MSEQCLMKREELKSKVSLVKDALPSARWMIVVGASYGLSEFKENILARCLSRETKLAQHKLAKTLIKGYV